MSMSIYGIAYDNAGRSQPRSPWRRGVATLLRLSAVALVSVAIGIYVFPLQ